MKRILSVLALSSVFIFSSLQVQARGTPSVNELVPNPITVGSGAQTLVIGGGDLQTSDIFAVTFKGASKPVTYIHTTKISVDLSETDVNEVGSFPVKVSWKNSAGDMIQISPPDLNLNITAASGTPSSVTILSMNPTSVVKGAESVTLKISGETLGTVPVEVGFDGQVATEQTVLDPNTIQVKIPGTSLATVRTAQVKVVANPSTTPVSKNFEFNITEAAAAGGAPGGPATGATGTPGAGADSSCSLNLVSSAGNAWFLIVALFGQITVFVAMRKK